MSRRPKDSVSEISKQWADAQLLYDFMQEWAADHASARQSCEGSDPDLQKSSLYSAAQMLSLHASRLDALNQAKLSIQNEFVAGRICGLGRRGSSTKIQAIKPEFWVGASVDWAEGSASHGSRTYLDIRIAPAESETLTAETESRGPGRPTNADAIRKAIEHYAVTDPGLTKPPTVRIQAYISYLEDLRLFPRYEEGYSEKTFQKYETEFRKKNK